MQTFLPYPDYAQSAACLDRQRLGKQRVEVLQLLTAIQSGGGWANHPAARMWKHNVQSLLDYGLAVCDEWVQRGYKDTCVNKMLAFADDSHYWNAPAWLGDPAFHASHRSNLLRKDPLHYGTFGWTEPPDLPYVWPVTEGA